MFIATRHSAAIAGKNNTFPHTRILMMETVSVIKLIIISTGTYIIRGEPERAPNTRGTGSGFICIIRGEPERAPNTRGTGSGFICIYIYMFVG